MMLKLKNGSEYPIADNASATRQTNVTLKKPGSLETFFARNKAQQKLYYDSLRELDSTDQEMAASVFGQHSNTAKGFRK